MTTSSGKLFLNKRKEPRNSYSGLISFVYRKNLYTGQLINYSLSGVTLPVSKFKKYKQKGRIVWKNDGGFGVQLFG
jgi:hypothetical protein